MWHRCAAGHGGRSRAARRRLCAPCKAPPSVRGSSATSAQNGADPFSAPFGQLAKGAVDVVGMHDIALVHRKHQPVRCPRQVQGAALGSRFSCVGGRATTGSSSPCLACRFQNAACLCRSLRRWAAPLAPSPRQTGRTGSASRAGRADGSRGVHVQRDLTLPKPGLSRREDLSRQSDQADILPRPAGTVPRSVAGGASPEYVDMRPALYGRVMLGPVAEGPSSKTLPKMSRAPHLIASARSIHHEL